LNQTASTGVEYGFGRINSAVEQFDIHSMRIDVIRTSSLVDIKQGSNEIPTMYLALTNAGLDASPQVQKKTSQFANKLYKYVHQQRRAIKGRTTKGLMCTDDHISIHAVTNTKMTEVHENKQ
jgi:hypothetical protein